MYNIILFGRKINIRKLMLRYIVSLILWEIVLQILDIFISEKVDYILPIFYNIPISFIFGWYYSPKISK